MAEPHDEITQTRPRRRACLRDLLVDDHVIHRRQVLTAVLLRPRGAEEARLVQRDMPFPSFGPVIVPRRGELALLLGQPTAQPLAERGLLLRVTKVQWSTPPASPATPRWRRAPGADTRARGTPMYCRYRRVPEWTSHTPSTPNARNKSWPRGRLRPPPRRAVRRQPTPRAAAR